MYYVIADIHGQKHLLDAAIHYIKNKQGNKIIFLGDYIDRGKNSLAVLDTIIELKKSMDIICLEGNHENMLTNDGVYTNTPDFFYCQTFKDECGGHIEDKYVDFFKSMKKCHIEGDNVFAHAAFDGNKPVSEQTDNVLLWYRYMHLQEFNDISKHLTHGHTPVNSEKPFTWGNRTCLDMGAMYGNRIGIGIYEENVKGPVGFVVIYSTGEVREY